MIIEIFSKVKDPRDLGKVKHELEDVLQMVLIRVLCDCEDCDDISDMVADREDEFRASGLLKLANGVPCGDTILRVVEAVNPGQLRACLDCCRQHIIDTLCGHHLIIDGKKLRGENPTSRGCNGLYILNAWVSEVEICVAEKLVDDKTKQLLKFHITTKTPRSNTKKQLLRGVYIANPCGFISLWRLRRRLLLPRRPGLGRFLFP